MVISISLHEIYNFREPQQHKTTERSVFFFLYDNSKQTNGGLGFV